MELALNNMLYWMSALTTTTLVRTIEDKLWVPLQITTVVLAVIGALASLFQLQCCPNTCPTWCNAIGCDKCCFSKGWHVVVSTKKPSRGSISETNVETSRPQVIVMR